MGMFYNVAAMINVNEKNRQTKKKSGQSSLTLEQQPQRKKKQYATVTGKKWNIQGWKETTLIIGTIIVQVNFIVANVQSALIGLPDINDNMTTIHLGTNLTYIGSHLHSVSMVLAGFHTPNETQVDNTANTRYSPTDATTLILGDIEELNQEANIPGQLRRPPQPRQQKQKNTGSHAHMPCRSWIPICVKANGQPQHHRKGTIKEQSLAQLDYDYI
eukprot:1904539-Amphidinium_carterae.1